MPGCAKADGSNTVCSGENSSALTNTDAVGTDTLLLCEALPVFASCVENNEPPSLFAASVGCNCHHPYPCNDVVLGAGTLSPCVGYDWATYHSVTALHVERTVDVISESGDEARGRPREASPLDCLLPIMSDPYLKTPLLTPAHRALKVEESKICESKGLVHTDPLANCMETHEDHCCNLTESVKTCVMTDIACNDVDICTILTCTKGHVLFEGSHVNNICSV